MEQEQKQKTNKKFVIIISVILIIGIIYGGYKFMHSLAHEETDDAQIEANMTPIIPHVAGYVNTVLVEDNARVKKGDTLLIIDNTDYMIQLKQAEANVAAAQSGLAVSEASIGSFAANSSAANAQTNSASLTIETAKIKLWRAENDFKRYENLYKNHSITAQQYEQASALKQEAEKQLEILQSQKKASASQSSAASHQTTISKKQVSVAEAQIQLAEAQLSAALQNLNYTYVTAPIDGQLASVKIQAGQFVQPGQSLFYLVNTQEKWVVANFKETQLEKMNIGQHVSITVDAYPDYEFEGIVTNFSPATGSKFSLLPPDNATGNFVKTIQRLPVKIDFTDNNDAEEFKKLRSGMNVNIDVHLK
ncbi:HlyD family secretion protein [Formosa algae]|jgi:membrane fusion protein (multidrug efflux system)|uniref:Membrane fusion protein (Multidrug efflux system) n=1 Tax=Formosa algae TaxID=225843 RepID=A0A9X1CBQ5_9FLAO|nr:HlyD family secretion protein [Formosa algae]MBP1839374.1 membrane fusion protein (multidrug efflux system) [Formosa algae]MDQ0334678.1 membrane fusion protein (multidrug efflux system) [Formosa algae]OEI81290.1 secretion protein HlyD [Formosa algae]PNW27771.1 secretion protein HlyD [Formosa algae]